MFLVKWQDYSLYECSWEPASPTLEDIYVNDTPCEERLERAVDDMQLAVSRRLCSPLCTTIEFPMDGDIYRHFFGGLLYYIVFFSRISEIKTKCLHVLLVNARLSPISGNKYNIHHLLEHSRI